MRSGILKNTSVVSITEGGQNGDGFGGTDESSQTTEFRRKFECGYRFMPNVSMRKLTKAIENEKYPRVKLRLLACWERKKDHSIRKIAKYLSIVYSIVRNWLVRMRDRGLDG